VVRDGRRHGKKSCSPNVIYIFGSSFSKTTSIIARLLYVAQDNMTNIAKKVFKAQVNSIKNRPAHLQQKDEIKPPLLAHVTNYTTLT
jgi:hypothetical protein